VNRDPKWVRLLNQHDLAGGELAWPEVMAFDAALWLLQKGVRMRSARAWPFSSFGHSAFRNLDMRQTHDLEFCSKVESSQEFFFLSKGYLAEGRPEKLWCYGAT